MCATRLLELAAQMRVQPNCGQNGRHDIKQCWLSSLKQVHDRDSEPQAAHIAPKRTAKQ